uniref:IP20624p n=2 Tax=Drosophila melanogaster TaxID=7227 RepID=B7FNM2_DROME|nr:IP20624p [Drosophila melanogaster]AOQ10292.1 CG33284-RA [synthetic construct]
MPGRPEKPMELIKPPRMSAVWFSTGPEVEGGSASRESTNCNININSNISNKSNKDEKSLASWLHEEISLDCQLGKNLFIFGSNELTERQADKRTSSGPTELMGGHSGGRTDNCERFHTKQDDG